MKLARSLRGRLLLATTAGVALILVVSSIAIYFAVQHWLMRGVDDALSREARAIAGSLERSPKDSVLIEGKTLSEARFSTHRHLEFLEIFTTSGRPLIRSPSLHGSNLPFREAGAKGALRDAVTLPGGRPARMASLSVVPRRTPGIGRGPTRDGPPVTLALARSTQQIEENLDQLQLLLAAVAAAAVVVSAGVLALAVRRGLRPVDTLAGRIADVDPDDLDHRAELPSVPGELLPIVSRLEELFDRLAAAQRREKGLIADVAHELRTPLAGLLSTLEVAAFRERRPSEYREAIAEGLDIAAAMQAIVENLLAVARLQAGKERVSREAVDLETLLATITTPLRGRAKERDLSIQTEVVLPGPVETDAGKLRIVLRNLLENAVSYADEGGTVRVHVEVREGRLSIRTTNPASAFPKEDAGRVFDRFWRADPARGGGGAHCGIGLPLVKDVVELLGGTVRADLSPKREFRVGVEIPEPGDEEASS